LAFSYWFDKPWFLTEGQLAAVLIIPSSWGSQLGGYLPTSSQFSGAIAGEKEDFCKGSFTHTHPLLCFSFALLYFYLHRFYQIYKQNSFLYSCYLLL
jgi:hypothetical protein